MSVREGKKISRAIKLRRIGLIVAGVSTTALVVILLFALAKKGTASGFTVKIDNPVGENKISMSNSQNGKGTTVLSADPLKAIWPTTAEDVETYLKDNFTVSSIGGAQNMPDTNPKRPEYSLAQVYTVFLTNNSTEEDQDLIYEVHLENYVAPESESNGPIDYLRVLCQTSVVGDDDLLTHELNNAYYGLEAPLEAYGTFESEDDHRECISKYEEVQNAAGRTVRKPNFSSTGNEGYCKSFLQDPGSDVIVQEKITIKAGQKMRFTYVSYLEGEDRQCFTKSPYSSQLMMSLHFGVGID